ncbi:MAG: hypothetical protein ACOC1G_02400 [Phycisphaeraceae bacterium]
MSVMGTGIAAAVAQTHATAREQKKVENKRQRDDEDRSRAIREAYEVHLVSLGDEDSSEARLHTDNQLDNEHDTARQVELIREYRQAIAGQVEQRAAEVDAGKMDTGTLPAPPSPEPPDSDVVPVRRLDVEA